MFGPRSVSSTDPPTSAVERARGRHCSEAFLRLGFLQSRAEMLWTAHPPARLPFRFLSALAWLAGPLGLPGCTVGLPWWIRGGESACKVGDAQEMQVPSLGREHPLEEELATHSSILAWGAQSPQIVT